MLARTPLQLLQGISILTTITTSARTFSNFPLQVAAEKKAKRMLSGKIAKKTEKSRHSNNARGCTAATTRVAAAAAAGADTGLKCGPSRQHRAPRALCTVWHGIPNCRCSRGETRRCSRVDTANVDAWPGGLSGASTQTQLSTHSSCCCCCCCCLRVSPCPGHRTHLLPMQTLTRHAHNK